MNVEHFLTMINTSPDAVTFSEVIALIDETYIYTPTRFSNGLGNSAVVSEAGSNEGSCKIFAFAQLQQLTQEQTLQCFGDYYRKDVLGNLNGSDHGNIRNFIQFGWEGIRFDGVALTLKS